MEETGVLGQTYPNIFVILLDEDRNPARRVSFSYTDVLTETVELSVLHGEGEKRVSVVRG